MFPHFSVGTRYKVPLQDGATWNSLGRRKLIRGNTRVLTYGSLREGPLLYRCCCCCTVAVA